MMHLSILLVIALNILYAQGRAQNGLGEEPVGSCTCTPFYKCHDEESSSLLESFVDDRSANIPHNQVITAKQAGDPNGCEDILDVCCYNLVPKPTVNLTSQQPPTPSTSQQPPKLVTTQSTNPSAEHSVSELDNVPTSCTEDRQPVSPNANCGVRNPCGIDFVVSRFKDGQAQYGEFPWMVAVLTANTGFGADQGATNLYVGGGSLIHPQVVLTAAHKVQEYQNQTLKVRLGEWNFASTTEPTPHQDILVRDIVIHKQYEVDRKIYNVALLVLERPAVLGETVGTICLASNPNERFDGRQNCIVSGWGKDVYGDNGRYQRILKSVNVNIVERTKKNDQCERALQSSSLGNKLGTLKLHPGFICAGDMGRDACTGDGGSPLVCPHSTFPGQYIQIGVVAWGIECGTEGVPGVYWAISPMMLWISDQLSKMDIDLDLQQGR